MARLRAPLLNLLVGVLSLAVVLAGLEGAARLWAHHLAGGVGSVRDPLLRFDPNLGWSKPPREQAMLHRAEYRTHLRINSRGLRGPEVSYEKPDGVRRVLLLGDSFVEGYTVEESATVAGVLEGALRAAGGAWEVINAGTHGWSTDQEYLFWRDDGVRYRPDHVVLFFYYNDLHGNVSADGKPRFEPDDAGGLHLANVPVPRPPDGEARGDRPRPFYLQPWRGSMALRLLSNRTSAGNPGLHRALARLGLVEPGREGSVPPELWPFSAVHRRETDPMWDRTAALLELLARDVGKTGARLTVFYVPARFEVDERAWQLTRKKYGLGPRWKPDRVVERLRAVCATLDLPLLDPRPELTAEEQAGRPPYYAVDGHWTEAGHAVAAAVLSRTLAPGPHPAPPRITAAASGAAP
jgi:hypothetical protein